MFSFIIVSEGFTLEAPIASPLQMWPPGVAPVDWPRTWRRTSSLESRLRCPLKAYFVSYKIVDKK